MASRIKLKVWHCDSCKSRNIYGPDTRCPNCGSSRPKDVTFHSTGIVVTDPEKLKEAYAGADIVCGHCDTHNKAWDTECDGCGNPIDYSSDDEKLPVYSGDKRPSNQPMSKVSPEEPTKIERVKYTLPKPPKRKRYRGDSDLRKTILIGLSILSVVTLLTVELFFPKDVYLIVENHSWERSIEIEKHSEVSEDGWSTPIGAYNITSSKEIHHYEPVYSHTETWTEQECKSVANGTESYVCGETCTDLGNGYERCDDRYCDRTIYTQECHDVQRSRDVYKDEPVYETYYHYKIMKWLHDNYQYSSGEGKSPYWPEVPRGFLSNSTYREGSRSADYYLHIREAKYGASKRSAKQYQWETINVGDSLVGKRSQFFNIWLGFKYTIMNELLINIWWSYKFLCFLCRKL